MALGLKFCIMAMVSQCVIGVQSVVRSMHSKVEIYVNGTVDMHVKDMTSATYHANVATSPTPAPTTASTLPSQAVEWKFRGCVDEFHGATNAGSKTFDECATEARSRGFHHFGLNWGNHRTFGYGNCEVRDKGVPAMSDGSIACEWSDNSGNYIGGRSSMAWYTAVSPTPPPTPSLTPSPSCMVTLYEHWPEGVNESIATSPIPEMQIAVSNWRHNFPTGRTEVFNGTGIFFPDATHRVASSVKVVGRCCEAYGYTDRHCEAGSPQAITSSTMVDSVLGVGVVAPAEILKNSTYWGCNDCVVCVKVVQLTTC